MYRCNCKSLQPNNVFVEKHELKAAHIYNKQIIKESFKNKKIEKSKGEFCSGIVMVLKCKKLLNQKF